MVMKSRKAVVPKFTVPNGPSKNITRAQRNEVVRLMKKILIGPNNMKD